MGIRLVRVMGQWRDIVKMMKNLCVPYKGVHFLILRGTLSFCKRILLHEICYLLVNYLNKIINIRNT
jgi:hypothetical protein